MPAYNITYNGYQFPFARLSVAENIVYDEAGIQRIGANYRFTIRGVLAAGTVDEFKTMLDTVRCKIMAPRKELVIQWSEDGGTLKTLWTFDPTGSDVDFGPHPDGLDIDEISAGRAAFYTWSCRAQSAECWNDGCTTSASNNQPGRYSVLTLTRTYSYQVNQDGFTCRTISGKLIVTSSEVSAGRNADAHRAKVVPPCPLNYKRTGEHFSLSPNGRELSFSITDEEVQQTLPQPITTGRASFSCHIQKMGGLAHYSLSGEFSAPSYVPKADIIGQINALMLARFPIGRGGLGFIWENRTITEPDIYGRNTVSFDLRGKAAATPASATSPGWLAGLGSTPPGSTGFSLIAGPYGGDGFKNDSGITSDSPNENYSVCQTGNGKDSGDPSSTKPQHKDKGSISSGVGPPRDAQGKIADNLLMGLSSEHGKAPYTDYAETVSYEVTGNIQKFAPKVKALPPILQQTAVSTLTIIQAGVAVRCGGIADLPVVPEPIFGPSQAYMKCGSIAPTNSAPLAEAGQFCHTISWRFVLECKASIMGKGPSEWFYPNDPRTTRTRGAAITTLPAGFTVDIDKQEGRN